MSMTTSALAIGTAAAFTLAGAATQLGAARLRSLITPAGRR
ncbi:MAG: hypothetical protein ACREPI_09615 [Candidatus Dormibacterales bacterium]